jgi:hypothetical protein
MKFRKGVGYTMLNQFMKLLFVLTSLAPILCVFAACDADRHKSYFLAGVLLFIAIMLVILCRLLIFCFATKVAKEPIKIVSISSTDKATFTYMIAYLLPVVSGGTMDLRNNPFISFMVMLILVLCVFHTNAFHFNPLLGLFGYHFYEIKTPSGNTGMFISNRTHRSQVQKLNIRELWDFVYLDAGDNEYEEVLRCDG